jgi:hypothetical protein
LRRRPETNGWSIARHMASGYVYMRHRRRHWRDGAARRIVRRRGLVDDGLAVPGGIWRELNDIRPKSNQDTHSQFSSFV